MMPIALIDLYYSPVIDYFTYGHYSYAGIKTINDIPDAYPWDLNGVLFDVHLSGAYPLAFYLPHVQAANSILAIIGHPEYTVDINLLAAVNAYFAPNAWQTTHFTGPDPTGTGMILPLLLDPNYAPVPSGPVGISLSPQGGNNWPVRWGNSPQTGTSRTNSLTPSGKLSSLFELLHGSKK